MLEAVVTKALGPSPPVAKRKHASGCQVQLHELQQHNKAPTSEAEALGPEVRRGQAAAMAVNAESMQWRGPAWLPDATHSLLNLYIPTPPCAGWCRPSARKQEAKTGACLQHHRRQ